MANIAFLVNTKMKMETKTWKVSPESCTVIMKQELNVLGKLLTVAEQGESVHHEMEIFL